MSDILLNIVSWYESDEKIDDESDERYIIRIFGRTDDDKSICVRVEDFTPHFYLKIPDRWGKKDIDKFVNIIKEKNYKYKKTLVEYDVVEKHDLHFGFCDNKKFKFIRLVFNSMKACKTCSYIFSKPIFLPGLEKGQLKLDTYEAKIDPFIRFIHIKDLNSTGWIILPENNYKKNYYDKTTTELNVQIKWEHVKPYKGPTKALAKLKICSFDIECISIDGSFPQASRMSDKIVSICSTFTRYGSDEIYLSSAISLDTCKEIKDCSLECYHEEKDVLIAWRDLIEREDPDIITGYNIFFFDMRYMKERAELLKVYNFCQLSRLQNYNCIFEEKKLSSSGLGDNIMHLYNIIGRSQIDLMKMVQRDYKLTSYKLDKVAENFMKEKVKSIKLKEYIDNKYIYLIEMNISKVKKSNYIKIEENNIVDEDKIEIKEIHYETNQIEIHMETEYFIDTDPYHIFICLVKDDMSPQELFNSYPKGPNERAKINQYCIQDCALVSKLLHKLEIVTNNMAMAEVSHVSLDYILMRGQGIKALSLFAKTCRKKNYLIKDLKPIEMDPDLKVGYEGATVLTPITGFYKRPIAVLDYNSLYPNSERALNMSPETLVRDSQYNNLPNYIYREVFYDIKENGEKTGVEKCVFVESTLYGNDKSKSYGIVPTILTDLLDARKMAKKMMEKEPDPFKKKIYDGKQLALKVTANSIYGQLGASTSPIFCKEIAASTTAVGRDMLELAKEFVEVIMTPIMINLYNGWLNNDEDKINKILDDELEDRNNNEFIEMMKESILEIYKDHMTYPVVIYGDTDSNFNDFKITNNETKEELTDYWCRKMVIKLGLIASKLLKKRLPFPQNMEYEKTFHPFSLMAKKRYIGNKYEENPDKYKRVIMGYTLKRRDNATIVHKVIGRAVEIAMDEMDIDKAINFIKTSLKDILDGKFPITDYITTKTLRANYKGENLRAERKSKKFIDNILSIEDLEKIIIANKSVNEIKSKIKDKLDKKHNDEKLEDLLLRLPIDEIKTIINDNIKSSRSEDGTQEIIIPPGIKSSWFWDNVNCSVAHVKLCQRIKERDSGNCPEINDRIPFVTVALENSKKMLQADRIEHPDYIIKNNLKIDYLFYISNQIMNPCVQFFELLTDELKDIFDNIIKTETDVNNKIYDNRARDKYFKKVEKYDIHITDSNHINNDWISETLINKKIEDNLIIKEKKNKLKSKKNTKKNTIDISLHLEGF